MAPEIRASNAWMWKSGITSGCVVCRQRPCLGVSSLQAFSFWGAHPLLLQEKPPGRRFRASVPSGYFFMGKFPYICNKDSWEGVGSLGPGGMWQMTELSWSKPSHSPAKSKGWTPAQLLQRMSLAYLSFSSPLNPGLGGETAAAQMNKQTGHWLGESKDQDAEGCFTPYLITLFCVHWVPLYPDLRKKKKKAYKSKTQSLP